MKDKGQFDYKGHTIGYRIGVPMYTSAHDYRLPVYISIDGSEPVRGNAMMPVGIRKIKKAVRILLEQK